MDKVAYQNWWQLHLRVSRGEVLVGDENAAYQTGLSDLQCSDQLSATLDARELRQSLATLQKEHIDLEHQRQSLDREIASLECRLSDYAREYLGVKE